MENNFDKFIRDSFENYEVEYNPAHWDRIEKTLDKKARNTRYMWGGSILAATVIAAAVYFNINETTPDNITTATKPTPVQNTKSPGQAVQENTQQTPNTTRENKNLPDNKQLQTATPVAETTSAAIAEQLPKSENNNPVTAAPAKPSSKDLFASINVNRSQGCMTEPFYFKADVNVPATYQWNFGDGTSSTLPAPSHAYANAGKYSVTLRVTSLLDGKSIRTGEGGLLVVNPKPHAAFDHDMEENENFSRKVEFTNRSKNITYSQWIIDGKTYNGDDDLSLKFNKKGSYRSQLVVKNEQGCYDTATQNIILDKDYNLLAPTAFTPNDDGHNDDFLPALLRNSDVNYAMDIVDPKSGNIIFSSGKKPWNGMNLKTGAKAEEGTYLWVITIIKPDNTKETYKGNLSLLR